jgi:hypothetical protein
MVYLRVRITSVNGLATALIALISLALVHWIIKRGTRKVGTAIGSALRAPIRALLTRYYRRKVIRQMLEEKRKQGIPPLENSDVP